MNRAAWLLVGVALLCTAVGEWARRRMPSCEDAGVLHQLAAQVRADRHLNGVLLGNVETLGGSLFAPHACSVLVTEVRGNVDLGTRAWTRLTYTVPLGATVYQDAGTTMPRSSER